MMNRKVLIGVGVIAGVIQAIAGAVMYLTGVYFAAWSFIVSLFLLLICIVVGTRWYTTHHLGGEITYFQAVSVGMAISICTGLVYAVYNMLTITWLYPNFLDELVRARLEPAVVHRQSTESFAAMRAEITATGIAVSNLIRLSLVGSFLSLLSSVFLKRHA